MSEKTPMTNLIITMFLEGAIIYTFLGNMAVALMAFGAAGIPMLSIKALLSSSIFAAIVACLFYLFILWNKHLIIKKGDISFPFFAVVFPEQKNSAPYNDAEEIEIDIDDIEEF